VGTPAGIKGWKVITMMDFPCFIVKWGVLLLESCQNKPGTWTTPANLRVLVKLKDEVPDDVESEVLAFSESDQHEGMSKELKGELEMLGILFFVAVLIACIYCYHKQRRVNRLERDINYDTITDFYKGDGLSVTSQNRF